MTHKNICNDLVVFQSSYLLLASTYTHMYVDVTLRQHPLALFLRPNETRLFHPSQNVYQLTSDLRIEFVIKLY